MVLFFELSAPPLAHLSFPTRRSSDLGLIWLHQHGACVYLPVTFADAIVNPRVPCHVVGGAEADVSRLARPWDRRSEEHTSELQSRGHLVCRLLLEQKNRDINHADII